MDRCLTILHRELLNEGMSFIRNEGIANVDGRETALRNLDEKEPGYSLAAESKHADEAV